MIPFQQEIQKALQTLAESYQATGSINHLSQMNLPTQQSVSEIIQQLEFLLFPGFTQKVHDANELFFEAIQESGWTLVKLLTFEIQKCLLFKACNSEPTAPVSENEFLNEAHLIVLNYLKQLPQIRSILQEDVQATLEGDPAAKSFEEIILSYPGIEAIAIHRLAHPLWVAGVPLLPRMMSEWVHRKTGIDIHPGAQIGKRLFIDHGTGIVINETCVIGENVKIYQGVTLGALSVKKSLASEKRHPTIEDHVTIYANATILGGLTTIGHHSMIGGNVWLTKSVPPHSVVSIKPQEYVIGQKLKSPPPDWQI